MSTVRPRFDVGDRLGSRQLSLEQDHRLQRFRRHNRVMHGWGVVCGLAVVPLGDRKCPWRIGVCPGYGIDKHGHEVYLTARADLDIAQKMWSRSTTGRTILVTIESAELGVRPILSRDTMCCVTNYGSPEYTRRRDWVRIRIDWAYRSSTSTQQVDVCHDATVGCPPCPPEPGISLARVRLPDHDFDPITESDIVNL